MRREKSPVRQYLKSEFEKIDFTWPFLNGQKYWDESVRYGFTLAQIEQVEAATEKLHAMCLDLVADIVGKGDYGFLGVPEHVLQNVVPAVEQSWKRRDPTFYGRFDFGVTLNHDNTLGLKMFECNADTPTGLYEASVVQWRWKEQFGLPDQFNSIEEKMDEFFRKYPGKHIHFMAMTDCGYEDAGTVGYISERAHHVGKGITSVPINNVGLGATMGGPLFVDARNQVIEHAFKLYAWEWMFADQFGASVASALTRWIEPPWKLLLTTKAILPLLWQKHPNHPNLLPAYFAKDGEKMMKGNWVKKPLFSREGANVSLIQDGKEAKLPGSHHNEFLDGYGTIGQLYFDATSFDGQIPVIGSWVIDGLAAGMSIREDSGVTGNTSRFVPHYFKD